MITGAAAIATSGRGTDVREATVHVVIAGAGVTGCLDAVIGVGVLTFRDWRRGGNGGEDGVKG